MRYGTVWPEYARWWDAMKINPDRDREFNGYALFALNNKDKYLEVENATEGKIPWYMVAVIHKRESDPDPHTGQPSFSTYLGNGQPLNQRTTIVPRGRGPFKSFLDGALDALKFDGLTSVIDWRLEKQLYYETSFNGWGYYPNPSPYIWGGTNIQIPGKYVRDGVYDSHVWDTQPGCAPITWMISKLDPTVQFVRED